MATRGRITDREGIDRYPPISAYALLSDCHGSALVSRDGSVDWCCLPRFDARPVFARLLDWDRGGYFRIAPAGEYSVRRRYLPGTSVLETRFETGSGVLLLTDFMALQREGLDDQGRFRRAFDLSEPDAAALMTPLREFLPVDDPHVVKTREWIVKALGRGGLVYRYLGEDGLPGSEGAFLACSFWLVEHLARAEERERATRMLEELLERRNDVGLLPEQVHPETGQFLGNFPQALSHIGLINAALALGSPRGSAASDGGG